MVCSAVQAAELKRLGGLTPVEGLPVSSTSEPERTESKAVQESIAENVRNGCF